MVSLCDGCANEMYRRDEITYSPEIPDMIFCCDECAMDWVKDHLCHKSLDEYARDEYYKNDPRV